VKSTAMNRMYRMYLLETLMGKKIFFLFYPPILAKKGTSGYIHTSYTLIIMNILIYISLLDELNVYGCTCCFI